MKFRAIAAAGAAASLLLVAAGTADTITIDSATRSGSTVDVTGTAAFAARGAQDVGGTHARGELGGSAAGDAAGTDLTAAKITEINNGLRFTWHVSDLPDTGIIPEGVRYNWAFQIGFELFQLQAKSSNVVSVTTAEDPVGHAQHAQTGQNWFQLRGRCTTAYLGTTVNGCYHLAFLKGSVDVDAGTVSIDLPFNTKDSIGRSVAPEFVPGVVLIDNAGAGTASMTIAASFQAAVSNTITSHAINGIDPYHVGEQVFVGAGTAGQNPGLVTFTRATLTGNTFSGSISGVPAGSNTVFVKTCKGVECTVATAPIT